MQRHWQAQELYTTNLLPLQVKIKEEGEPLEQDWNAQESDLDGIVNTHNQIFGSVDLVQRVSSLYKIFYLPTWRQKWFHGELQLMT